MSGQIKSVQSLSYLKHQISQVYNLITWIENGNCSSLLRTLWRDTYFSWKRSPIFKCHWWLAYYNTYRWFLWELEFKRPGCKSGSRRQTRQSCGIKFREQRGRRHRTSSHQLGGRRRGDKGWSPSRLHRRRKKPRRFHQILQAILKWRRCVSNFAILNHRHSLYCKNFIQLLTILLL